MAAGDKMHCRKESQIHTLRKTREKQTAHDWPWLGLVGNTGLTNLNTRAAGAGEIKAHGPAWAV